MQTQRITVTLAVALIKVSCAGSLSLPFICLCRGMERPSLFRLIQERTLSSREYSWRSALVHEQVCSHR